MALLVVISFDDELFLSPRFFNAGFMRSTSKNIIHDHVQRDPKPVRNKKEKSDRKRDIFSYF